MRSDREYFGGEEVDFFELLQVLWRDKLLILLLTVIAMAVAFAYVSLKTPIYEVRTYIQPPSQNDIASLNHGRGGQTGLGVLSAKDVYQFYTRSLRSESVRQKFFREVYLPSLSEARRRSSQDELYSDFGALLQVVQTNGDANNRSYIQVRLSDPAQAVEWSQRYAQLAGEQARRNVIRDVRADAQVKANNLEQEIFAGREVARKQREDQLAKLTEALSIARSVGLKEPPIISETLSSQVSAGMGGTLTYMRGAKALEAEIENLRNRASDDPYVPNLRQLQEALVFYRGLQVDPKTVEVYAQDGVVDAPDAPISPKKPVIIAFSVLFGLALGVFVSTLKWFLFGRKIQA